MFDRTLSHTIQVTLNSKPILTLPIPVGKWREMVTFLDNNALSWLSWNTLNQYGSIRNEFTISEKMTESGNLVIKVTRYGLSDKAGQLSAFIQNYGDYNDLRDGFIKMLKVYYK